MIVNTRPTDITDITVGARNLVLRGLEAFLRVKPSPCRKFRSSDSAFRSFLFQYVCKRQQRCRQIIIDLVRIIAHDAVRGFLWFTRLEVLYF